MPPFSLLANKKKPFSLCRRLLSPLVSASAYLNLIKLCILARNMIWTKCQQIRHVYFAYIIYYIWPNFAKKYVFRQILLCPIMFTSPRRKLFGKKWLRGSGRIQVFTIIAYGRTLIPIKRAKYVHFSVLVNIQLQNTQFLLFSSLWVRVSVPLTVFLTTWLQYFLNFFRFLDGWSHAPERPLDF